MKIKKIVKGIVLTIAGFLIVIFLKYLFSDEEPWESPYDEQLIDMEILLDATECNLGAIVRDIERYVVDWTGSDDLMIIDVNIKKEDCKSTYCMLIYRIDSIDDYFGYCEIICCYENGRWIIKRAEKYYYNDDLINRSLLQMKNAEETYEKSMDYLQKNNFFEGTDSGLLITANKVEITIYATNEKGRYVLKRVTFELNQKGGNRGTDIRKIGNY